MSIAAIAALVTGSIGFVSEVVDVLEGGAWVARTLRRLPATGKVFERVRGRSTTRNIVSVLLSLHEAKAAAAQRSGAAVQRLADNLYYSASPLALRSHSGEATSVVDSARIGAAFAPFSQALATPLVVTPVLSLKPGFGQAILTDPDEVLLDPQPIAPGITVKQDATQVPLFFFRGTQLWIGWQKRRLLAELLDCDYLFDQKNAGGSTWERRASADGDRYVLDIPAYRSSLLGKDRHCRIRLSRSRLEFECESNRWRSFELSRQEITGIYLDTHQVQLALNTRSGKVYRLEAKLGDLQQVREALLEL